MGLEEIAILLLKLKEPRLVFSPSYWSEIRPDSIWNILKTKKKQDLHSGVFGGSVPEAMVELSHIFASLVDPATGKILIKDLEKEVNPGTDSQIFAKYKINIDMQTHRNSFQK